MVNNDLKKIINDYELPDGTVKEPNRVLALFLSIDNLKASITGLLTKDIKNTDLTISECFNLMKILFISKEADYELIKKMAQQVKSSEDLILLLSAAFHHRKNDSYIGIVVKELSDQEISYKVWLEVLNYEDPWYFRISSSLERLTLSRIFESEVDPEVIVSISYDYFKKSTYSTSIMLSALSNAKISPNKWQEIRDLSTRKEIKTIAQEKINQLRRAENQQICQT